MTEYIINPLRYGKSAQYNRISKEKAFDICSRKLRPTKPPIAPKTCWDCYYHDGRCELGRTDGKMCVRFHIDWSFSNKIHKKILHDYDWCVENFHHFCQLDKECFVAIYGKKNKDGVIVINKENGDLND